MRGVKGERKGNRERKGKGKGGTEIYDVYTSSVKANS